MKKKNAMNRLNQIQVQLINYFQLPSQKVQDFPISIEEEKSQQNLTPYCEYNEYKEEQRVPKKQSR